MAEIDNLEIQVKTQAEKANSQLDAMADKLRAVAEALELLQGDKLKKLSQDIDVFTKSTKALKNVKLNNLDKLSKDLESVAKASQTKMGSSASKALEDVGKSASDAQEKIGYVGGAWRKVLPEFEKNPDTSILKLEKAMAKCENTITRLTEKQKRHIALGGSVDDKVWQGYQYDIDAAADKLDEYIAKIKILKNIQDSSIKNMTISRPSDNDYEVDDGPRSSPGGMSNSELKKQSEANLKSYNDFIKAGSKDAEKANEQIVKLQDEVDKFKAQISDMSVHGNMTEEFVATEQQIDKVNQRIESLLSKLEAYKAAGIKEDSYKWQQAAYEMETNEHKLKGLLAEQNSLIQNDQAFVISLESISSAFRNNSAASEAAQRATEKFNGTMRQHNVMAKQMKNGFGSLAMTLSQMGMKIQDTIGKFASLGNCFRNAGNQLTQLSAATQELSATWGELKSKMKDFFSPVIKLAGKLKEKMAGLSTVVKRNESDMSSLKKVSESLSKSIFKLGNMFKLMATRMAMRSVINGMKEGFQNLAQYSNSVNVSISSLMSSLNQLKNAFATAFAPALNVAVPILDTLISYLVAAANAVGQLLAALTGQSSYVVAKKVTTDYAASLGDAASNASAAKKATQEYQKTLMGFDQINKLSDQSDNSGDSGSGSGGSGGGVGDMFDTVAVESKYQDLAAKIKDIAARIFKPMKDAWNDYGKGVMDAWSYALREVKGAIVDIGRTWLKVWENGTGYTTTKNILLILQSIGLWIGDIAVAWRAAWDKYGETLVQSIFNLLNAVLELIYTISETFRGVWNDGTGERVLGSIMKILTNIIDTVTNLVDRFKLAWDENDRGKRIAEGIAAIIETILGFVERVTDSTKKWADTLDFGPLLDSIGSFLEKIKVALDNILPVVENIWKNAVQPLMSKLIESWLPWIIDKLGSIIVVLSNNWDKILALIAAVKTFKAVFKLASIIKTVTKLKSAIALVGSVVGLATGPVIAIVAVIASVVGIIVLIITNLDWLKEKASEVTTKIRNWFRKAVDDTKQTWNEFIQFFKDAWEAIKEIFSVVRDWFVDVFSKAWEGIKNAWSSVKEFFSGLWESIKETFANVVEWFRDLFAAAWEGIKNAWSSVKEFFSNLWESIKNVFASVATWFKDMFSKAWEGIKNAWSSVKSFFSDIWTNIKSTFSSVGTWFKDKFQSAWSGITGVWGKAKSYFSSVWTNIKGVFSNVSSWFKDTFSKAWEKVKAVFSSGGAVFSGIKDGILNGLKSVINALISGINKVIAVPFNGLNSALKSIKAVSIMGLKPFSFISTISVPTIPKLAGGGLVEAGQLFIANEAGPELVGSYGNKSAVMNNDQIVDSVEVAVTSGVYKAVMAALSSQQQGGALQVVKVDLSGKTLLKAMVEEVKKETKSTGVNPLMV